MELEKEIKRFERKKEKFYNKIYKFFVTGKKFDIKEYKLYFTLTRKYILNPKEINFIHEFDMDFEQLKKDLKFAFGQRIGLYVRTRFVEIVVYLEKSEAEE